MTICPSCNDNRSYRIGNRTVVCGVCVTAREIDRAVANLLRSEHQLVQEAQAMVLLSAPRPEPTDTMGKWLMGRVA